MKTIDEKVKETICKEFQKLSSEDKKLNRIIQELDMANDSHMPDYKISPKDTIGKNIFFNTIRR